MILSVDFGTLVGENGAISPRGDYGGSHLSPKSKSLLCSGAAVYRGMYMPLTQGATCFHLIGMHKTVINHALTEHPSPLHERTVVGPLE